MAFDIYNKTLKELGGQDGRVKLTEKDKELIRQAYETGTPKSRIAKAFNVCRRTIDNVLDPSLMKKNYERVKARGGSKLYYNKESTRQAARRLRQKKRDVRDMLIKLENKGE